MMAELTKTEKKEVLSGVKVYTTKEIEAFTDAQLEEFAARLQWKDRYDSWSGVASRLRRYRTSGHPARYGNNMNVTSRRQFLILRLKSSRQETWNPAAKEALKAAKEKKEADAKKKKAELKKTWETSSKVSIKVETKVRTVLTDCRWGGYSFWFEKEGDKFKAGQVQQNNLFKGEKRVGRQICTANGKYDPQEILDALDLLGELDLPKSGTRKKGKAEITVTATLVVGKGSSYPLQFGLISEGVVGVSQNNYRHDGKYDWHFNIKDMKEALETFNKKYEVKVVKK